VVLLSGGLDSVVNLKCALDGGPVRLAITFDYGQAAFINEKQAALRCADRYGIPHRVVQRGWFKSLVPPALGFQSPSPAADEGQAGSRQDQLREVWVPNRNCVFISIGAAFAEYLEAQSVVIGLNREEAEVFPDNSVALVEAMNQVLSQSTLSAVRVVTHTGELSKPEIVRLGLDIGAPLELVYSCYRSSLEQVMCGNCQSCRRLKKALDQNGILAGYSRRFAA
jgi:7-cyano-7-deazaguanine synthase